jgi:hypothetical protein
MTTGEPSRIDVGDLTTVVIASVRQALERREAPVAGGGDPPVFRNPRIIVGVVLEPGLGSEPPPPDEQSPS